MLDGQYDGALLGAAVVGWEDGLKEGIPVVGREDEGTAVVGNCDGSELGTSVCEGCKEGAAVVGKEDEGTAVVGEYEGSKLGTSVVWLGAMDGY